MNRSIYFLQWNKEHNDVNWDQANYGKTFAYLYKAKYDFQSTSVKKKKNRWPKTHIVGMLPGSFKENGFHSGFYLTALRNL